mgnify:CR=1 FL=1
MNWKECASRLEAILPGGRFHWPGWNGFDCSQDFTISDVWGGISWIWTWPGDWILSREPLATFFEIEGSTAIGATGSTILGFLILLIIVGLLGSLMEFFEN